jgi:hypothetical protein
MFGFANAEVAAKRARDEGYGAVVFVPADGSKVQICGIEQGEDAPATVVAYQRPAPDVADLCDPLAFCTVEQLLQLSTLDGNN